MFETSRTEDAIESQIVAANHGGSPKYPGMSYEDGVRDALAWVIGESDDEPMADE